VQSGSRFRAETGRAGLASHRPGAATSLRDIGKYRALIVSRNDYGTKRATALPKRVAVASCEHEFSRRCPRNWRVDLPPGRL